MQTVSEKQRTLIAVYPPLRKWIDGFLIAKRASGAAKRTAEFYGMRLAEFAAYCEQRGVTIIDAIDAALIREFILHLQEKGHNPGGVHSYYRAVRAFLYWYEREAEPDGWRNRIKRVDAPKVPEVLLEPVEIGTVARMVEICDRRREGLRDRAILLTLLDTGIRASELTALDLVDFDVVTGSLVVRRGKGGKPRVVFLGQKTRKAVRAYLRARGDFAGALFATRSQTRMSYHGLRSVIMRRAKSAGVDCIVSEPVGDFEGPS